VGNGHPEKREAKKPSRKINSKQYLIEIVSGAGTVFQATRRGGRKALAFGVAHYFHWFCPCFPDCRHRPSWRGAFGRATGAFLLLLLCPLSHYSETASVCWGAAEGGSGHAASPSLRPGLTRRARPAATAARVGPYAPLAPVSAESPCWLLLSCCFS